jgi:hypothetical protein
MLRIWANLGLLLGGAILAGLAWFVLYIIAVTIFEDLIGGLIRRIKRKRKKDRYIY